MRIVINVFFYQSMFKMLTNLFVLFQVSNMKLIRWSAFCSPAHHKKNETENNEYVWVASRMLNQVCHYAYQIIDLGIMMLLVRRPLDFNAHLHRCWRIVLGAKNWIVYLFNYFFYSDQRKLHIVWLQANPIIWREFFLGIWSDF